MTRSKGVALLVTVAAATALLSASGPGARATGSTAVHLRTISAKVGSKGTSLVIEATDPIAYVATRPDPLTVVVDFRNVIGEGVANSVTPSERSPIASVDVEPGDDSDTPSSRVRVGLVEAVAYHVRSARNTIVLEFDKPSLQYLTSQKTGMAGKGARSLDPSASTPDAMAALRRVEAPTIDPVTALSLLSGQTRDNPPSPEKSSKPALATFQASAATLVPQTTSATQSQPAPTATPGARKFTGAPVSLDFQGADLRAVLRTFSEISGLNIVIDPAVNGTVDVALRDVPWDQALDIILRANKLGYIVDGTIVRIAPLTVLADEESQRRKLSEEQALAGQVQVLTKTLSYANATALQPLLTRSALSQRGSVQVDQRTNTLIITDLPDRLTVASDLIATLDKPQPQVEIEARIVQANKNYLRTLGVQWGFEGRVDPTLGNTTGLAFPNSGSLGGRAGSQGPAGVGTAVNLPATPVNSAIGLALGSINGAFNLDFALSAAESSGNVRVLSTPRVTALNNDEALILQGVQIPIQTVANNTVTVAFRDAALSLKVTPQITAAGTVIMKIALENATPDFSRQVNGIPPINTQRANTEVLVNDGQTTVIGGILISQEQYQQDRTPGLGQVPLLRWLFKRDSIGPNTNNELVIFITPKITRL